MTLLGLMFFALMAILYFGAKTVESRNRKPVFATADGTIAEVLVQPGEVVEKGQLLAVLRNPNLEFEVAQLAASAKSPQRDLLLQKTGQLQVRASTSGRMTFSTARLLNRPAMRGEHLFTIQGHPPFDSRKVLAVTGVGLIVLSTMLYRYRKRA